MRRLIPIAAVLLLLASFAAGLWSARKGRTTAPPIVAGAAPSPPPARALPAAPAAPIAPRFTPPPIPADDPGVAELVNAPAELPAAALKARLDDTDRRLEELFGKSFPEGKRAAVRVAQAEWIRSHQHAVQDYYKGRISQPELTLKLHQNMLTWSAALQASLSPDEFRRFTDLEPGADPFVQLVPQNVQVGQAYPSGTAPPPPSHP